jgi:hypothetical protein
MPQLKMQNQDDDVRSQSDCDADFDENDRQLEEVAQASSNIGVQSNDNNGGVDTNTGAEETDGLRNSDQLHQYIISSMNQVPKFSDEWFMLKEKEISLLNHDGLLAAAADEEESADQMIEGTSNRTVEPIADGVGAPASNAQVRTLEFLARPEQMSSTNDARGRPGLEVIPSENAPAPTPLGLDNNDEDSTNKKIMTGATLEQVSDDSVPVPMALIEQNKDDVDIKMGAAISTESSDVDIENNSHGVEDEVPSSGNSTQLNQLHSRVVSFLDSECWNST